MAQDAASLVALINSYRSEPRQCEGRSWPPAGALSPSGALTNVQIAPGDELVGALKASGYAAAKARVITLRGPGKAHDVMAQLRERFCTALLDPRISEVGVQRESTGWRVILAQPLVDEAVGSWVDSGRAVLHR